MINMCMIHLGKDGSVKELEPLNELFVSHHSAEEIYHNLYTKYGIEVYEETKGEINDMCNFSKGIYEDGIKQGKQEGKEQGILTSIKGLMNSMSIQVEEAMDLLQLSDEMKERCRMLLTC